jgi:hypothetical protein
MSANVRFLILNITDFPRGRYVYDGPKLFDITKCMI